MLDNGIKGFLEGLEEKNNPPLNEISISRAREIEDAMMAELLAGEKPHDELTIEDDSVSADYADKNGQEYLIPIRHYKPVNKTNDWLIIYYHGGGWVHGGIGNSDIWCRKMAVKTGSRVLSVGYRCAPEYKFPIPFEDCYSVCKRVGEKPERYGTQKGKIALCGDSAGGNLSAAVCLAAKDRSGPEIGAQFLIYPVTDLSSMERDSYRNFANGYLLTLEGMEWFTEQYLEEENQVRNPYVSPLLSESFSDLPPAIIATAGYDPLKDEGSEYSEKLKNAGVDVQYKCYPDLVHAFIYMGNVSTVAMDAIDNLLLYYRSFLERT